MKAILGFTVAAGAVACLAATPAQAQQYGGEQNTWNRPTAAPRDAFELSVGTGYTQGFGRLTNGNSSYVRDIAQEGLGVNVGVGYRFNPRWSLGVDSQYQEFHPTSNLENNSGVRGMTAGISAAYHFSPYNTYDPYLSFGTGYRMLWEIHPSQPDVLRHGFEFGKLAVGIDLKATPEIALGPFVGADLNYFSFERVAGPNGSVQAGNVANGGINTFLFAGLQGKFDIGGLRERDVSNDTYVGMR